MELGELLGARQRSYAVPLSGRNARGSVHISVEWLPHELPPQSAAAADASNIAAVFRTFDRNRSGFLDPRELREALRHYGVGASDAQIAEVLRRYDSRPSPEGFT